MTIDNILMTIAVILAPLVALRVEKYLEKNVDKKERKLNIFKTLMATRGNALDPRHVEALNMIDMEFYDHKDVTDSWKEYLDHLIHWPTPPDLEGKSDEIKRDKQNEYKANLESSGKKRESLLAELLVTMAKALNYSFDKTYIKRSIYSPQGHADIENEQNRLRRASIDLLEGRLPLPVINVTAELSEDDLKMHNEEQAEQKLIRELLIKHYNGEISTSVKIINE